jgi:hypothetical protein
MTSVRWHAYLIRELTAMPCNAEIHRRYATRDEAFQYLASRGFLCSATGWVNGR